MKPCVSDFLLSRSGLPNSAWANQPTGITRSKYSIIYMSTIADSPATYSRWTAAFWRAESIHSAARGVPESMPESILSQTLGRSVECTPLSRVSSQHRWQIYRRSRQCSVGVLIGARKWMSTNSNCF